MADADRQGAPGVDRETRRRVMTNTKEMSFDQKIQILNMLGTWVAGLGAIVAASVALWLARRVEKVKLKSYVGLRVIVGGYVSQECLNFSVTNLGERSVTVISIGWRVGGRKNRKFAIQPLTGLSPDQCPKKIEYGEMASFMVNFSESPDWMKEFVKEFVSDRPLKTLRAQIHTSVGHTENVKPEKEFLEELQTVRFSS